MKMKGLIAMESPSYAGYEDPRTRYRHQSLLQDYEELQKETEAVKRKLLIMEQKKLVLSSEVSFLRRRYEYLTRDQFLTPKPKQGVVQSEKFKTRPPVIPKGRNYKRKESTHWLPVIVSKRNRKERTHDGVETSLSRPYQVFDLNKNVKNFNGMDVFLRSPAPALDLNQKEGMLSMKQATKSVTPVFDLNEISREEDEELQVGCELLNMEEPKRNIQRNASDEQQHDMKILVCRTAGGGAGRMGKRKISWQDQVALRV